MNVCDVDGSKLVTRDDDREEVIRERLDGLRTADQAGSRILRSSKGRLVSVNGDLPVDEVTEQIFRVIESQRGSAGSEQLTNGDCLQIGG